MNAEALRLAIQNLAEDFPEGYRRGAEYLRRLEAWEGRIPDILEGLKRGDESAAREAGRFLDFRREALLANPLLDFDEALIIKRKPLRDPRLSRNQRGLGAFSGIPQQSSWQIPRIPNVDKYENEIMVLSDLRGEGRLRTLYRPTPRRLLSGLELRFDADSLLFAMPTEKDRHWQVFEIAIDGKRLRQVTPSGLDDVHNFDPCYLPSGRIVFESTAPFQGVPCNPSIRVAMTYAMDADGGNIRQLTFEQDHNYYPRVTNDGRIMYLRWEYTDIPHVWGRYIFTMNPDGTGQRALYGSGSYWPNSIFYARPIPDHPTRFVGIVTGHHEGRDGELMIFDPAMASNSVGAVVQQIPFRGRRVKPEIKDKLTEHRFPRFIHPFPLSGKYFLVSAKPTPGDLWGIYLVDVFDNVLLLKEVEGHALYEPIPIQRRRRPPVIPDSVDLSRSDALVYVQNVYEGPGLAGVPPGSVKRLRLYTYHFAYNKVVGISYRVGTNGPWEPKRILGTVPVEADGSALFRVPANTPISIQPLDSEGRALQLMRSWTTAMPGEFVSCVGCHEQTRDAPPNQPTIAQKREPSEIAQWRGAARGFSFRNEVQPVLDRHCVSCHDGGERDDGKSPPDLRRDQGKYVVFRRSKPDVLTISDVPRRELFRKYAGVFEPSFIELRSFVRVGGLESDLRLQPPGEFHADTSELVQMLRKGHHGVQLDAEAWDRLVTWIDLNAPCHGTWSDTAGADRIRKDHPRRMKLRRLYSFVAADPDPELLPEPPRVPARPAEPVRPEPAADVRRPEIRIDGWPFDADEARRRQASCAEEEGAARSRTIDLGGGVTMDLVLVPAGAFVMGDPGGCRDETPHAVGIGRPFWIGTCEVTNVQFGRFDPAHDSRYEHAGSMIFSEHDLGALLNRPAQPVVRVSWLEAMAFCRWLGARVGEDVSLPTEAEWEWACRAGTDAPMSYGGLDRDFSRFANTADVSIRKLAHWGRHDVPDLIPRDNRFDDGHLVTAEVGKYEPNAWGLRDMHGNVWEWTRSGYEPYPYVDDDRNSAAGSGPRTVRGGSWNDRPKRCRSAFRLGYPYWRKVHDVGFRVVVGLRGSDDRAGRE
jgi:formylglycine-generating enzyme required for sulfatase activity